MSSDPDIIEATNHNFKYKNPYKVATIIAALVVVGMVGLLVYVFLDNSDKIKQIADLQAKLTSMNANENGKTSSPNSDPLSPEDIADYVLFENAGIMIPLSPEIKNKIVVSEIKNSDAYQISSKMILDYREKGYCGNGGTAVIGVVSRNTVAIQNFAPGGETGLYKKKSAWSDATVAQFDNNVVFPDEYVTFNNLDAVCLDYKDGHEARLKEVAKEVQEINDALEEAFLGAEEI